MESGWKTEIHTLPPQTPLVFGASFALRLEYMVVTCVP